MFPNHPPCPTFLLITAYSVVLHTSDTPTKDKCIDIPQNNDTIGQYISQWDCLDNGPAQMFTIFPLALASAPDSYWVNVKTRNLCFEVHATDATDVAVLTVQLGECDSTNFLQQFSYESGRFRNRKYSDKCIESKGNAEPILMTNCNDSTVTQIFAATAGGEISIYAFISIFVLVLPTCNFHLHIYCISGIYCPTIAGYIMTPGVEAFGSGIDIACHDGSDLTAAATECNSNVECNSFLISYKSWNGRSTSCTKKSETWTNLNKYICFYKKHLPPPSPSPPSPSSGEDLSPMSHVDPILVNICP
jgi:hypothetical protein